MKNIIVYSSLYCPYCNAAKLLLEQKNLKFKEILIDKNSKLRNEMIRLSNGRKTVPQIFFDELHIGGYDDLKKIDEKGNLIKFLKDYE